MQYDLVCWDGSILPLSLLDHVLVPNALQCSLSHILLLWPTILTTRLRLAYSTLFAVPWWVMRVSIFSYLLWQFIDLLFENYLLKFTNFKVTCFSSHLYSFQVQTLKSHQMHDYRCRPTSHPIPQVLVHSLSFTVYVFFLMQFDLSGLIFTDSVPLGLIRAHCSGHRQYFLLKV